MQAKPTLGMRWFVLALGLLIYGCDSTEPETDPAKVVVVGSEWYGHAPVWWGIESGIFERYGLEIDWRNLPDSVDRVESLSEGDAHFASVGTIAMLQAMAVGNRSFYWVGSQDNAPGLEGIVAAKGINSLDELEGKKIGTPFNSSADWSARLLMRQVFVDSGFSTADFTRDGSGKSVHDHVTLVNLKIESLAAALASGKIDAASAWEPYLSRIRSKNDGAKILTRDDSMPEGLGAADRTIGPDALLMSRAWADDKLTAEDDSEEEGTPSRAQCFLAAYFEALDRIKVSTDKELSCLEEIKVSGDKEHSCLKEIKDCSDDEAPCLEEIATKISGTYIKHQYTERIQENLRRIHWQGADAQERVMSKNDLYSHLDMVVKKLYDLKAVPTSPVYQAWVRRDLWPKRTADHATGATPEACKELLGQLAAQAAE